MRQNNPDIEHTHKIALLATGDELSNGDILNTNAQAIARQLFDQGMEVGLHLVVADNLVDIETAISFLLSSHRALIITGGLGPTSDDLTRFALGNALHKPLIFDQPTWENILARFKKLGYDNIPVSNRQQALFPEGAVILPNPQGSAAGCQVEHHQQLIFMLPGPPHECLPMFQASVLPALKKARFSQEKYHKNWFLLGVSEGEIAEKLDALVEPYQCTTGYRFFYPYTEFKLQSQTSDDFAALLPQIESLVQPYIIGNGQQIASELLRNELEFLNFPFTICDKATGGLLEFTLKNPKNYPWLNFVSSPLKKSNYLHIEGLNEFWQNTNFQLTQTTLTIDFYQEENLQKNCHFKLPLRNEGVKKYAVELICRELYHLLKLPNMKLKDTDHDFNGDQ